MVLGKRAASSTMMSGKRAYTGANRYTRTAPARRGFYGRRYGRAPYRKGYNQQMREIKYQTTRMNMEIDNTGFLGMGGIATGIPVNLVDVGADVKQRIGRRITMKTLQLNCIVTGQNVSINEKMSSLVRIMAIYDRQSNGATNAPALTDYLDVAMQSTSATGVTHLINAGKNLANKDRFIFLLDKTYNIQQMFGLPGLPPTFTPIDSGQLTTPQLCKKFYINLKNLNSTYNGVAAALSNLNEGAIYIVAFTDKTSSGISDATWMSFTTRVRYVDL